MIQMKPCPKCGSNNTKFSIAEDQKGVDLPSVKYTVWCRNCFLLMITSQLNVVDAIEAWNTRTWYANETTI